MYIYTYLFIFKFIHLFIHSFIFVFKYTSMYVYIYIHITYVQQIHHEILNLPLSSFDSIPCQVQPFHIKGSPEVGIGPTADQFTHLLANSKRERWKIHHLATSNTMPMCTHEIRLSFFICFLMHLFICINLYYLPSLYSFAMCSL